LWEWRLRLTKHDVSKVFFQIIVNYPCKKDLGVNTTVLVIKSLTLLQFVRIKQKFALQHHTVRVTKNEFKGQCHEMVVEMSHEAVI
jgi:hypothetical protein